MPISFKKKHKQKQKKQLHIFDWTKTHFEFENQLKRQWSSRNYTIHKMSHLLLKCSGQKENNQKRLIFSVSPKIHAIDLKRAYGQNWITILKFLLGESDLFFYIISSYVSLRAAPRVVANSIALTSYNGMQIILAFLYIFHHTTKYMPSSKIGNHLKLLRSKRLHEHS